MRTPLQALVAQLDVAALEAGGAEVIVAAPQALLVAGGALLGVRVDKLIQLALVHAVRVQGLEWIFCWTLICAEGLGGLR